MTLLLFDGFDVFSNSGTLGNFSNRWDNPGTGGAATGTTRFSAGNAWTVANGTILYRTIGSNVGECILGGAYRDDTGSSNVRGIHTFYDGATKQCTITAALDGTISLRRGSSSGTIVTSTAAGVYVPGTYHGLSFRVKFSATVGEFQVYKDGTSVYSATSLNTISTANAYCTVFALGADDANTGFHMFYDDFYFIIVDGVTPNTFPGDVRCYALAPTSDASVQFSHSSGSSNFAAINENNATDDSIYNFSNTATQQDLFGIASLPGGFSGTILAVATSVYARKDDAGPRTYNAVLKSSSTTVNGTSVNPLGLYTHQIDMWTTDPATSGAWVSSAVNAAQIGYKLTV